ncbi:MAG: hypothetical protein XD76_1249 [candidate division TA06 bacterium 32_111]|uniref:SPOR domain-containing protein n=2 Tax=Bacteria candidate phyla TaxID=1783234 RepID=A0A101I2E9_UNCT6|nr:MAG: hypothetical protein XD76_1249 [candidate division TA06 bacterium 32_111]KUK86998.1 MAG: hypothetical protein XE03_1087 [candidate division TA06 bacterium 34_109]HAF06816.1 hypothetical protein [candidate division WOR-3 bacterium]HCP17011.1 hypothetical protein [candidate division WOR-3 bacterium]
MKKDSFFLVFLILFILFLPYCKKNYVQEKIEQKKEKSKENYSFFVISENGFDLYDKDFNLKRNFSFKTPILSFSDFKGRVYVMTSDSKISVFNKKLFDVEYRFSFKQPPTLMKVVPSERGFFYISKNKLIYKDKQKEETVISVDTNFVEIFKNPYQSFLYIVDEKGFLYSIDFIRKILKRRLFVGDVLDLGFEKYGTRLIVVSPKTTLILDFETLNIIEEIKDFFTNCYTFEKKPKFYLYSYSDGRIFLYDGIKYVPEEKFEVKDKSSDIKSFCDSILIIHSKTKNAFDLFINGKRTGKFNFKNQQEIEMKLIYGEDLVLTDDTLVMVYNIFKDSSRTYTVKERIKDIIVVDEDFKEKVDEKRQIKEFYTIQIYSLSNEISAKNEMERLKTKNPEDTIFVNDTTILDKKIYRIYLGFFENKNDASIKREELIKKGYGRDIIIKKKKIND